MDIEVRTLREVDVEVADTIVCAAFEAPGTRADELRRLLQIEPDGWLMGFFEGRPVGMVGSVNYDRICWIGMMAVLPSMQSKGVGRVLFGELLKRLDERGCSLAVLDATKAGAQLYPKVGFVEHGESCQYHLTQFPTVNAVPDSVEFANQQDLADIAAFDHELFGANRTKMLQIYMRDYPGRTFLTRDPDGNPDGYLIAQPKRLGPWLARSPEKAALLLQAALTLPFDEACGVIIPGENTIGIRLLNEAGFLHQRTLMHMHMQRGQGTFTSQRDCIYGQGSYAVG